MKPSERRKARRMALQAIYSWQLSKNSIIDIEKDFLSEQCTKGVDIDYFRQLLVGVANQASKLDSLIEPFLDRQVHTLDPIEKAILRLSIFELRYHHDVPMKVVMNEAIELAKAFGATESHKYINGVLDKFVHDVANSDIRSRN